MLSLLNLHNSSYHTQSHPIILLIDFHVPFDRGLSWNHSLLQMSMNVCVLLGSQHKKKTANAHYRCYIYKYIIPFSYKATGLFGNCMRDIIYRLACMCYMQLFTCITLRCSLRTQTYFRLSLVFGGDKRQPEIRLRSQAT